jgi:GT2 family glycosyltransferase
VLKPGPRVVALMVTSHGSGLLRRSLTSLAAQSYPHLELMAVDNASTDGSPALLAELLGADRVLLSDVDLGFAGAVDLALDALAARDLRERREDTDDDLLLLLHDDLELEPDAVAELVAAVIADDRLAIVGPKLRWLDEPERLQTVGATIDLTGRVDDGLDPGELDQGQHDHRERVLFVSTAGMLVRRRLFDELGRFDRRTHAFREDLDLCWRAAIAGYDVEVVTSAVGRHARRSAEHVHAGRVAELGPRFLAERNTLAALLKNYGPERLVVVLPLAILVGLAKIVGFLVTRRVTDARHTLSAWGWNLVHLRATLSARRRVQRARRRSDRELSVLFGRITPRLRAYLEAVADRLTGDSPLPGEDVEVLAGDAPDAEPDPDAASAGAFTRIRMAIAAAPGRRIGLPALVLLLLGVRDALLPGPLHGGDLARFPDGPGLVARYLGSWQDSGATLSGLDPSPAMLVPGLLQLLLPGQGGLAVRALLVVPPLLAWVLAVRALAPYVRSGVPRVVLATLYVTSPPAVEALAGADLTTLVMLVALPALVLTVRTVLDERAEVEVAWRRLAVAVLVVAGVVSFEPAAALLLPLLLVAGVLHALFVVPAGRWRTTLAVRVLLLTVVPFGLLGPWLLSLPLLLTGLQDGVRVPVAGPAWSWLALDPHGRLLGVAGAGLVLAGLLSSVVAVRSAPRATALLLAAGTGLPLAAFALDVLALDVRTGPLLVSAAFALIVLTAIGWTRLPGVLATHAFGWRQVGLAVGIVAVLGTSAAVLLDHVARGTPGMVREEAVPSFVAALGAVPPQRVLIIGETSAGIVWEVVPATGPDLGAFGVRHDPRIHADIEDAVADLLTGLDPRAAARLGRLGVGAVIVPEGMEAPRLDDVLRSQISLDPLPSLTGRIARVTSAIPTAAVVTGTASLGRVPDPSDPPRAIVSPLTLEHPGRLVGSTGTGGDLIVAVPFGDDWTVLVDGRPQPQLTDDGLVRVRELPADATVEVVGAVRPTRQAGLWAQAGLLLLLISLGLRPPRVAVRNARARSVAAAAARAESPESSGSSGASGRRSDGEVALLERGGGR